MKTRWVVLRTDWFECIEAAVPFLMKPGDTTQRVNAADYMGPRDGETDVIMNPHRALELAPIYQANETATFLYETENLLADQTSWRAASAILRDLCPGVPWLNYSRVNAGVFGDRYRPLERRYGHAAGWAPGPAPQGPDVLFVGSMNARRLRVLRALAAEGLRVHAPNTPTFGHALAALEQSARLVLNVHYYEPGVFESFRVVPAVHRGATVLSETSEGGEGAEWCKCVPYSDLVETALSLLKG
jgi:hypothetical protein